MICYKLRIFSSVFAMQNTVFKKWIFILEYTQGMFTYAKLLAIGIGIGIFRYLQRKCTKSKMILRVRYPAIFFAKQI